MQTDRKFEKRDCKMTYTLITGASSGIGYEMAKVFAEHGHNLILTARSESKLRELKASVESQFKIQAEVIPADLSKPDGSQKLFQAVQSKGLSVDILINNAGFGDHGFFHESNLEKDKEMVQVNITTLIELTYLFLPSMLKARSGKIMNVASTAAFQPGPFMSVYYATKAFVLFFSEGLCEELDDTGVSVTVLCPGPTKSGFHEVANLKDVSLLDATPMATSLQVAAYGYKALMRDQAVAIPGVMNNVMATLVRFVPRGIVRKLVKKLQQARRPSL